MAWWESIPHPTTVAGWTLLLAAFGLLSLVGLLQQLRDARKRFRTEVQPYLRVDLAPEGVPGTWAPRRDPDSDLTYEEINHGESPPASQVDQWGGDVPVYLWVENTQRAQGGIADNVAISMLFTFPDREEATVIWEVERTVIFSYVEPNHLNRYEVARITDSIPWLHGAITEVRYSDMFGQGSSWAHGSAEFDWQPPTIDHIRRAFRPRVGLLGRWDRVKSKTVGFWERLFDLVR